MAQSEFHLDEYMIHHVSNAHTWHLPIIGEVNLPSWLSLHALMLLIVFSAIVIIFCICRKSNERIPSGVNTLLEMFVQFIRDHIARPHLGEEDGDKFTPMLATFFIFILFMNLIGLIPIFATPTANINVTGPLALIALWFMIVGTIAKKGIGGFFHALAPSGVPVLLLPFIVFLEFVGIFIKAAALMIRLTANMLAGHMVLLSLLGLVVVLGVYALPAVVLAQGIYVMEFGVAFLQAYVFTLLTSVFIGLMYHAEH